MSNRGEGSLKIHEFQWDKFWPAVDSFTKLNEKEQKFITDFLQPGDCNDLWITTFRDCLSEYLGFGEQGSHVVCEGMSLAGKEDKLSAAVTEAILRFGVVREEVRRIIGCGRK